MKVLAVMSQKGGVGKTTLAMNLADIYSEHQKVLLVDTDPQKSSSRWARSAPDVTFDAVTEDDPTAVAQVRHSPHDLVVVDTPGSLADEEMLSAVLDVADFALIPTSPDALSLWPLAETVNRLIKPRGLAHGVVFSKVDVRSPGGVELFGAGLEQHGIPVLRTTIRSYLVYQYAPEQGTTVMRYPRGRGGSADRALRNATDDLRRVAAEVALAWGKQPPAPKTKRRAS